MTEEQCSVLFNTDVCTFGKFVMVIIILSVPPNLKNGRVLKMELISGGRR